MAIQTGLEGKPWYFGAAAGAFVAAALVAGAWYGLVNPRNKEIEARVRQLDLLQIQINEGRAAKQKLPQFREEVRRLELELEKLLRILPARRNTPELLRRIRQLTEQGNFDLLRFTPGNFIDKDFYSEWPIAIRLNGSYHNLALFFDRVGRFSRIVNIEGLKISALNNNAKGHTINATFTAKTFIYREAPPPEPVTTKKGKALKPLGPAKPRSEE
ncbi:MAG: type 4a pilus biogenesis protein PilO [Thermoanaerobaculia bacterium]